MYLFTFILQSYALSPDDFGIRMDGEVLTKGNLSFDTSFQRDGYQSFSYPSALRYGFAPKWEVQLGSNVLLQQTGVFQTQGLYSQILYKALKGHAVLPSTAFMISGAPKQFDPAYVAFRVALDWAPAENDVLSSNLGLTWNEDAYMDSKGLIQNGYSVDFYLGDDYAFFPFEHQLDLYLAVGVEAPLYDFNQNQFTILTEFAYQLTDVWNIGCTTQSYPKSKQYSVALTLSGGWSLLE
jgi:hypothetical protein